MKIDIEKLRGMTDEDIQKYVYTLANREAGKKQVRKSREEKITKLFEGTGVNAVTMKQAESYLLEFAVKETDAFKSFVKDKAMAKTSGAGTATK
ncbi:MAG: hypothetical protein K6G85_05435 [Eubacterium sp.]|nr:hypothetical protein [Eubacterium sp.]